MKKICKVRIGEPKNINQLSDPDITQKQYRHKQKLLIIDDDEFPWKDDIEKAGYSATHMIDAHPELDFSNYTIILCDIEGVGKHLGLGKSGLDLMKSIKANYPLKPVVIYSGKMSIVQAKAYTDLTLNKDADFDAWIELLDKISLKLCSPKDQWKEARNRLIELNLPLIFIAEMEDKLVRYMEKNNKLQSLKEYEYIVNDDKNLPDAAKTIILNLISSWLFSLKP